MGTSRTSFEELHGTLRPRKLSFYLQKLNEHIVSDLSLRFRQVGLWSEESEAKDMNNTIDKHKIKNKQSEEEIDTENDVCRNLMK